MDEDAPAFGKATAGRRRCQALPRCATHDRRILRAMPPGVQADSWDMLCAMHSLDF